MYKLAYNLKEWHLQESNYPRISQARKANRSERGTVSQGTGMLIDCSPLPIMNALHVKLHIERLYPNSLVIYDSSMFRVHAGRSSMHDLNHRHWMQEMQTSASFHNQFLNVKLLVTLLCSRFFTLDRSKNGEALSQRHISMSERWLSWRWRLTMLMLHSIRQTKYGRDVNRHVRTFTHPYRQKLHSW